MADTSSGRFVDRGDTGQTPTLRVDLRDAVSATGERHADAACPTVKRMDGLAGRVRGRTVVVMKA